MISKRSSSYGERSTPHQVLSRIASRLNTARASSSDLAELLAQGTGAVTATIWRLTGDLLVPEGTFPGYRSARPMSVDDLTEVDATAPVQHLDENLGLVTMTKEPSDPVTPADRDLLESVAATAGLVLHNEALNRQLGERAVEVRGSRQRLVAAQDAERRRLERDLHDGAQQQVVALKVKLGLARKLAEREGADALAASLAALSDETQDAVDSMRAVAHGIYPPLLEAEGLPAALNALQRTAPVPVTVHNGGLGRYDQRIEQTAYFFVSESVDRAHMAGAGDVQVEVADGDGQLTITLEHDGQSTDTDAAADRIDAFGGSSSTDLLDGDRNRTVVTLPTAGAELEAAT